MHPLEHTISVIGPIVGGIIVLTVFFKIVSWLDHRVAGPSRIRFKGMLDDKTRATIHLANGSKFENVRILGFTDPGSAKTPLPFELAGMVILEQRDGTKVMVQAKLIRMIEVPPDAALLVSAT
ncbi:MAG: hypothetical protein WBC44_03175 [Planctomycetaceae bacterium]